jgi:hypothetical protein
MRIERPSLPRAATLGKHGPACVGGASEQAGALERFVPLWPGRQQARALQRIRGKDFLIDPVRRPLRFFHRRFASHLATWPHHAKGQQNAGLKWTHGFAALFPHWLMLLRHTARGERWFARVAASNAFTRSLPARTDTDRCHDAFTLRGEAARFSPQGSR